MTIARRRLIDMMIDKRIEWPEGAKYASQDYDQKPGMFIVCFYSETPERGLGPYWVGKRIRCADFQLDELCVDWHKTIIDRDAYETALRDRK